MLHTETIEAYDPATSPGDFSRVISSDAPHLRSAVYLIPIESRSRHHRHLLLNEWQQRNTTGGEPARRFGVKPTCAFTVRTSPSQDMQTQRFRRLLGTLECATEAQKLVNKINFDNYISRLPIDPITVGPGAPVGAAPPTRSQLRLQQIDTYFKSKSQTWPPPALPHLLSANQCITSAQVNTTHTSLHILVAQSGDLLHSLHILVAQSGDLVKND
jgi:hypothetical protein